MSLSRRHKVAVVALLCVASATTVPNGASAESQSVHENSIWNTSSTVPSAWAATSAPGGANTGTAGSATPRTIIGDDDRVPTPMPHAYPARTTVFIMATDMDGRKRGCTGFMYGPRSVATSAHCLLGTAGWNTDFTVTPAVSGAVPPYGVCGWLKATVHQDFSTHRGPEHDVGALQLDCTVGQTTGWLSPGPDDFTAVGDPVSTTGYPLDKALWEMWSTSGNTTDATENTLRYDLDTVGGQSGSAVTRTENPSVAVAIHSSGFATDNVGVRLNNEHTEDLLNWSSSLPDPSEPSLPSSGSSTQWTR